MGTFIFLLIFFFILLPLGRVVWAVWRQYRMLRRHMRDAEAMRDAFARGASGGRAKEDESGVLPRRKKKKIARDVGEYVAFEEVKVFSSQTDGAEPAADFKSETQVEDADWEEIK